MTLKLNNDSKFNFVMNHKINPKFQHNTNHDINSEPHNKQHHSDRDTNNFEFDFKLPQGSFKDFLKSKVHRPHVSPDFIEQLKSRVTKS